MNSTAIAACSLFKEIGAPLITRTRTRAAVTNTKKRDLITAIMIYMKIAHRAIAKRSATVCETIDMDMSTNFTSRSVRCLEGQY